MPRKLPLPAREGEIARRFRAAREAAGMRLTELARRIGANVNSLSSYEHGRNPMPYLIGARIARETNACQRWLATGALPKKPFIPFDEVVDRVVPARASFSEVYSVLLERPIVDWLREEAKAAKQKLEMLDVAWPEILPPLFA